jgi:hypothetical protein
MNPWNKAAAGLWFGETLRPFRAEFDAVLTFSPDPPPTDEGLRHRWMPLPDDDDEIHTVIDEAIAWLQARWQADRSVLVQSPACDFAELVVASLFVHLGATADEAALSLQEARPLALAKQRYLDLLRDREVRHA